LPFAAVGLVLLSIEWPIARAVLAAGVAGAGAGGIAMRWPRSRRVPTLFAFPGFALASILAGMLAWVSFARGQRNAVWTPTQRSA
jgi:hypothetical protein